MKIKIGPTTNDFQVLDDDGADITAKLLVTRIAFEATGNERLKVVLECYANVEISMDSGKLTIGEPREFDEKDVRRLIEIG